MGYCAMHISGSVNQWAPLRAAHMWMQERKRPKKQRVPFEMDLLMSSGQQSALAIRAIGEATQSRSQRSKAGVPVLGGK